jgi:hypothetical protein
MPYVAPTPVPTLEPTAPPCEDDDDQMVALAASQGQTISGCAQVASFCSSPTFGSFVQEACPVTCDSCTRRLADMKHSYANDFDRIEELTVVAPAAEVWQRIHEFGNSGTDAFYP